MYSTPTPHCPCCGLLLQRRRRRWHERLLALLLPQRGYRRYACTHAACGWRGLLRGEPPGLRSQRRTAPARQLDAARGATEPRAPRR